MQNKFSLTLKSIAGYALSMSTTAVFAHNGHGLEGSHWHATDAGSFVVLGAIVALAVWLARGGK
jgi:hypothetical protein